jgi:hypothetical protein
MKVKEKKEWEINQDIMYKVMKKFSQEISSTPNF